MNDLAQKDCVPCKGNVLPLKQHEIAALMPQLADGWRVVDAHHLEKEYAFKDFREGLDFVNKVGELAERQSHHPDLYLAWGKAKVTLWTHKIDGLAESDFVMAAKIDEIHG